jgi:hypothetical protein
MGAQYPFIFCEIGYAEKEKGGVKWIAGRLW